MIHNSYEHPLGRVMMSVKRNATTHYFCFYVVKSCATLILGSESCIGMELIKILDSDTVHSVTQQSTIPRELIIDKVLKNFKDVSEGIGELPGECTIPEYIIAVGPRPFSDQNIG